jgi:hypothetical protein
LFPASGGETGITEVPGDLRFPIVDFGFESAIEGAAFKSHFANWKLAVVVSLCVVFFIEAHVQERAWRVYSKLFAIEAI